MSDDKTASIRLLIKYKLDFKMLPYCCMNSCFYDAMVLLLVTQSAYGRYFLPVLVLAGERSGCNPHWNSEGRLDLCSREEKLGTGKTRAEGLDPAL